MLYLLLLIAPLILGFVAQRKVSGTFAKWSDVPSTSGRTGVAGSSTWWPRCRPVARSCGAV